MNIFIKFKDQSISTQQMLVSDLVINIDTETQKFQILKNRKGERYEEWMPIKILEFVLSYPEGELYVGWKY